MRNTVQGLRAAVAGAHSLTCTRNGSATLCSCGGPMRHIAHLDAYAAAVRAEERARLEEENARLRDALETVATIHERHVDCSQVERIQQAYDMRCVARRALTGADK